MEVRLKLFATFRQYLPPGAAGSAVTVDVERGTAVRDLLARFQVPEKASMMVLVNGRWAEPGQVLEEDDVVAVFPAMAGG